MPRPKKDEKERFIKNIQIRFTELQYQEIKNFITSITQKEDNDITSFLREIILKSIRQKEIKFNKIVSNEYLFELRKIGTNLNQITKKINIKEERFTWENEKIKEILEHIVNIINKEK